MPSLITSPTDAPTYSLLYRISSTMWFIIVLVLFVILGFSAVFVLLYLRPGEDNLPILSAIFAFLALLVSGMFGILNKKMDETHSLVNSRMSDLIAKTEAVSEALGYNKALQEAEAKRVAFEHAAQAAQIKKAARAAKPKARRNRG